MRADYPPFLTTCSQGDFIFCLITLISFVASSVPKGFWGKQFLVGRGWVETGEVSLLSASFSPKTTDTQGPSFVAENQCLFSEFHNSLFFVSGSILDRKGLRRIAWLNVLAKFKKKVIIMWCHCELVKLWEVQVLVSSIFEHQIIFFFLLVVGLRTISVCI